MLVLVEASILLTCFVFCLVEVWLLLILFACLVFGVLLYAVWVFV